jgi:hypothetical protein
LTSIKARPKPEIPAETAPGWVPTPTYTDLCSTG